jgi:hypothetical protein
MVLHMGELVTPSVKADAPGLVFLCDWLCSKPAVQHLLQHPSMQGRQANATCTAMPGAVYTCSCEHACPHTAGIC